MGLWYFGFFILYPSIEWSFFFLCDCECTILSLSVLIRGGATKLCEVRCEVSQSDHSFYVEAKQYGTVNVQHATHMDESVNDQV